MRSAWVGAGARSSTRCIACSCSVPSGAPLGITLDPPTGRVGRGRRDAGQFERPRVDPGAVVVAVREHGGPVGHDRVERGRRRRPAGEVVHRPAAADHPLAVGMRRPIRGDPAQVLVGAAAALEIALRRAQAAHAQVAVSVDEAGQHQRALQVDDARAGAVVGPRRRPRSPPRRCGRRRSRPRRRCVRPATVRTTAFRRIRSAGTGRWYRREPRAVRKTRKSRYRAMGGRLPPPVVDRDRRATNTRGVAPNPIQRISSCPSNAR